MRTAVHATVDEMVRHVAALTKEVQLADVKVVTIYKQDEDLVYRPAYLVMWEE